MGDSETYGVEIGHGDEVVNKTMLPEDLAEFTVLMEDISVVSVVGDKHGLDEQK